MPVVCLLKAGLTEAPTHALPVAVRLLALESPGCSRWKHADARALEAQRTPRGEMESKKTSHAHVATTNAR